MSELKAGVIRTPHNEGVSFDRDSDHVSVTEDETEFYLKSEADKEIAEKDEEMASLRKSIRKFLKADVEQVMDEVLRKTLIYGDGLVPIEYPMKLVAEVRRQKYKRCFAMANWCFMRSNYHYLVGREEGGQLAKDSFRRSNLYLKWCDRWQRLAEQFKEDK